MIRIIRWHARPAHCPVGSWQHVPLRQAYKHNEIEFIERRAFLEKQIEENFKQLMKQ